MDEKRLFIDDKVYKRYYRVSVSGSMPCQDSLKIDAWTIATERPHGSHIEDGTSVYYDYWLTMDELVDKFNADPLIISDAVWQMCESENFFDSLFDGPKHDESYDNIYFRVLVDDAGCFDIDGCVKTETRPADSRCDWRPVIETYKTWLEIMTDCPELLPTAIYIHAEFKPESVGEALAF